MKFKAFILLLHFFTYFISGFAAANCCEVKPAKTTCCKRMVSKHCPGKKCPKPSENNTNNCYNCPLNLIATVSPAVNITILSVTVKKEFNLLQNNKLSRFVSSIWKPPNVL